MILNLDKWRKEAIAAIDSQGQQLTYGELRDFAERVEHLMPARSLMFLLVENNVLPGRLVISVQVMCH